MPDANVIPSEASHSAALSPQRMADSGQAETRKRPKPGERKVQILQALASMLEQPGGERVTTAALAARLDLSEAALYRHFASKAQMFEGLIEFIEQTVFLLINQIVDREQASDSHSSGIGVRQCAKVIAMLAQFAEKNPGMARVMVGDALVFENERLQQRMNQFFDKIEATLKQCLRDGSVPEPAIQRAQVDPQVRAAVLVAFAAGRLQRFVRSGFKRLPTERLDASLALLLG
jgi:TetR/AcrR family transcriptional regulator